MGDPAILVEQPHQAIRRTRRPRRGSISRSTRRRSSACSGPNGAGKTTAVRVLPPSCSPTPDAPRCSATTSSASRRRCAAASASPVSTRRSTRTSPAGRTSHGRRARPAPAAGDRSARRRAVRALRAQPTPPTGPLRTYSGGMRRRLDLAASLVHRPPVLFLDEPTTGLDPTSRNELWDMIRELVSDGTTVLLTTQYLEEADQLADRIAVIDDGHVIAKDTPARLKSELGDTVVEMGFADEPARRAGSRRCSSGDGLGTVERDGSAVKVSSNRGAHMLIETLRPPRRRTRRARARHVVGARADPRRRLPVAHRTPGGARRPRGSRRRGMSATTVGRPRPTARSTAASRSASCGTRSRSCSAT